MRIVFERRDLFIESGTSSLANAILPSMKGDPVFVHQTYSPTWNLTLLLVIKPEIESLLAWSSEFLCFNFLVLLSIIMTLEFKLGKIIEQIMAAVSNNEDLTVVFNELDLLRDEIMESGDEFVGIEEVVNSELEARVQELRNSVRDNKIWLRMAQESLKLALGSKV